MGAGINAHYETFLYWRSVFCVGDWMTEKKRVLGKIYRDIKSIKIQGAENVAKAGLKAYSISPTKANVKKLSGLRPTEPMLFNCLRLAEKYGVGKVLNYIKEANERLAKEGTRLIRKNSVVFTHCHSSSVMNILKSSKKKFEVFNTETRPLLQGRKTAKELSKAGIHVTTFVDSVAAIALTKNKLLRKSNFMLVGADAIVIKNGKFDGVINKVGSNMFAEIAKEHKIPVYIASSSLKLTRQNIKIEKRSGKEVWNKNLKGVKVVNPAFDKIEPRFVKRIISEFGIVTPKKLVEYAERTWNF